MTLQAQLDNQVFDKLTLIDAVIEKADAFEANQMRCFAVGAVNNSTFPLNEWSDNEVENFQNNVIEIFKLKGWVK